MTLNDLIRKATRMSHKFTSGDLKLYDEAFVEITNISFEEIEDEDDGYIIQMTVK